MSAAVRCHASLAAAGLLLRIQVVYRAGVLYCFLSVSIVDSCVICHLAGLLDQSGWESRVLAGVWGRGGRALTCCERSNYSGAPHLATPFGITGGELLCTQQGLDSSGLGGFGFAAGAASLHQLAVWIGCMYV